MRTFTKFEAELIDLVVWLLEGLKNERTTERATNRILRTTLRRIDPRIIGESINSKTSSENVLDHAIPLKVVVSELCEAGPSKEHSESILDRLLVSVKVTKHEHNNVLRLAGLDKDMPPDWDGNDLFARYKRAGIEVELK
jgi:hypothetical protein